MKNKSKSNSNVLIRSDRNLLGLGLLGTAVLLGVMFIGPHQTKNLNLNEPGVALEEYEPQSASDTFASEPEFPDITPDPDYLEYLEGFDSPAQSPME